MQDILKRPAGELPADFTQMGIQFNRAFSSLVYLEHI